MADIKEKEKENIKNEIRLLSQLVHPNIVTYKESFLDKEQSMFIVMNYCEDGDLYKKIRSTNHKQFSEE